MLLTQSLIKDNIFIPNVTIKDCVGGFLAYGAAKGARIGVIILKNCSVVGETGQTPMKFVNGEKVILEKCEIEAGDKTAALFSQINIVQEKRIHIEQRTKNR